MKITKNMVIGTLITASVVGGIAYAVVPKKDTITIRSLTWRRTIDVEEYKEVEESGWEVPTGATVINIETKERADTDVNGHLTYSIKPYYTYKIKRWVVAYTNSSDGTDEITPFYADKEGLPDGRRYGNKTENYCIVDENGEVWACDYAKWSVLHIGSTIRVSHYRGGKYINKMEVVK